MKHGVYSFPCEGAQITLAKYADRLRPTSWETHHSLPSAHINLQVNFDLKKKKVSLSNKFLFTLLNR